MEIKILSSEKIKPATPTPENLRKYKLSLIDQLAITDYIPMIFFYDDAGIPQSHQFNYRLKGSLSETLTLFYPLAGRISMTDKVFVDCNDSGVLYEEAFVDMEMSEFLDKVDLSKLEMFLPFSCLSMDDGGGDKPTVAGLTNLDINLFYGIRDNPIAGFRVTEFRGGGVVVGASVHHTVVDGAAMANFLRTWASVERYDGLLIKDYNFDITASSRIFPPLNHFPFEWSSSAAAAADSKSKLVSKRLIFTAESINALKKKSSSEEITNPTRVEALTAFLWKHMMLAARSAAKGGAGDPPTKTILMSHVVDFRNRVDPPLPPAAFGNVAWPLVTWYKSSALEGPELPELSEKVRKLSESLSGGELKKLQGEEAFSEICDKLQEYMENLTPDTDAYKFTSWCNLGLYEVDFGWGTPIWVATSSRNNDEEGVIFMDKGNDDDDDDDGIEVWVVKYEEEMNALENDDEFLAYAVPIRGIVR